MCGLFGVMNYSNKLKADDINNICNALAVESEERGRHATGISYISKGKLIVNKAPVPAHRMRFHIPNDAVTVMGHTRHATQGSEKKQHNNHPFIGKIKGKDMFALAHNGIIYNDTNLRKNLKLPKTKIETDSYIAVQLIEQQGNLDFDTLRYMAEQVKGSFSFTIMDNDNSLYIVKGDSPVSMLKINELNLIVYASTDTILYKALTQTVLLKFLKAAIGQGDIIETIDIKDGTITKIERNGSISASTFQYNGYSGYNWWNFDYVDKKVDLNDDTAEYLGMLKIIASDNGMDPDNIDALYQYGFSLTEIEELIYDPMLMNEYFNMDEKCI